MIGSPVALIGGGPRARRFTGPHFPHITSPPFFEPFPTPRFPAHTPSQFFFNPSHTRCSYRYRALIVFLMTRASAPRLQHRHLRGSLWESHTPFFPFPGPCCVSLSKPSVFVWLPTNAPPGLQNHSSPRPRAGRCCVSCGWIPPPAAWRAPASHMPEASKRGRSGWGRTRGSTSNPIWVVSV
jgi:hypothetical protein